VRTHLIETARPLLEQMVQERTGGKVVSLHHDVSTTTGEELVVFTLAAAPDVREVKRKWGWHPAASAQGRGGKPAQRAGQRAVAPDSRSDSQVSVHRRPYNDNGEPAFVASDLKPTRSIESVHAWRPNGKGFSMNVSKYNKAYDTADGSEQQQQPCVSRNVDPHGPANDGSSAERWEDDGGAAASAQPVAGARSVGKRPSWSVLSLRDLLKAIRLSNRPESAAAIRDREDGNRKRVRRSIANDAAESARIDRDRYRNAWENS